MRGGGNKFRVKHNRHLLLPEGGGSRELLENRKTVGKEDRRPTLVKSSILRGKNSNCGASFIFSVSRVFLYFDAFPPLPFKFNYLEMLRLAKEFFIYLMIV